MNSPNPPGFESRNFGLLADLIVTRCKHLLTADIGGETIILNRNSTCYFSTSDVGAFIWSLLQRPTRLEAIRDAITAEFAGSSTGCEPELLGYIAALIAEDLVFLAPKSGS